MTKDEFIKQVVPLGEKLFRLAFRMLEDSDSAKDLLQESYLKLWEIRDDLKKYNNLEAFATTVIKNKCLDKIKLRKKTIDIMQLKNETERNDYEYNESFSEIKKIMQTLPKQQKRIVELRDIEGYSNEEIADLMDLSVNNVRVQISFARKKIKEDLVKIYEYGIAKH
jgi:RNA polymerase sigma-70 factor (ECF subfamily)